MQPYLVKIDEFGNLFMTYGAGTADGDSSWTCMGTLTKGINRANDWEVTPVQLEPLPLSSSEEVRLINDLFEFFGNYLNDLPYACVPEMFPDNYNSNSFARGLLEKVGAPLPAFPNLGFVPPGWSKPVPSPKFDPR